MKYLILRKPAGSIENLFTRAVAADFGTSEPTLPFEATTEDLQPHEAADLRRDPNTEEVIVSLPFTLIEPVEGPQTAPPPPKAWGIEAVGAMSSPYRGEGVTVAVLDSGIQQNHPAFAGRTFAPADLMDFTASSDGQEGSAPDTIGHGTHVAGTIFGGEVNGVRIGVAPKIKKALIGKIIGPSGAGTDTLYNAIDWALRKHADIISMSLGINFPGAIAYFKATGLPENIAFSRTLEAYRENLKLFDRLAALVQARVGTGSGAILVAASGNESDRIKNPVFTVAAAPPGAADGFTSVGALAQGAGSRPYFVASFSNTGCRFSAPGVDILSASLDGGLIAKSGTSMATPHVAGVMALWTQKLFAAMRQKDWAEDVLREIEHALLPLPGQNRNDVGLGMVRAPQ